MSNDFKTNSENDDLDSALKEIDSYLAENDPDFLKNLSNIQMDDASLQLSVLDQAISIENFSSQKRSLTEKFFELLDFKNNTKTVLFFWLLILCIMTIVYFILHTKLWDKKEKLFLTSYADLNVVVQDYNPLNGVQSFFDNPRVSKNNIILKKMVVNLKKSENSSMNSMLAFEVNIEGMSKEVVIEIKDRESEFVDKILRATEEFTSEELSEKNGKQKLADKFIDIFNTNLTSGQVRKVLLSTFILNN